MHKKLFIPGPTEVRVEVLKELSRPMIGHRSKEFSELYEEIITKLKRLLYTENECFISTSSALGVMEACVRNCVKDKALNLVCGAFSEKWYKMVLANGKKADKIEVEWGKAIKPEMVEEKLSTGNYDAVFLTHSETSTGVMNPIYDIANVIKNYDVIFMVDAVSSMAGVKLEVDKLGIDVCLASVQKCFALPPGLAVFSCSERALKKAEQVSNRGYYFDFLNFLKYGNRKQTISTPPIPQMYALNKQLDDIFEEGLENRFKRHELIASYVRDWAKKRFALFAEPGYEAVAVTCVKNIKNIDIDWLNNELAKRGKIISNGYGKLKDKTFRIGHLGDLQLQDIKELLNDIDDILGDER